MKKVLIAILIVVGFLSKMNATNSCQTSMKEFWSTVDMIKMCAPNGNIKKGGLCQIGFMFGGPNAMIDSRLSRVRSECGGANNDIMNTYNKLKKSLNFQKPSLPSGLDIEGYDRPYGSKPTKIKKAKKVKSTLNTSESLNSQSSGDSLIVKIDLSSYAVKLSELDSDYAFQAWDMMPGEGFKGDNKMNVSDAASHILYWSPSRIIKDTKKNIYMLVLESSFFPDDPKYAILNSSPGAIKGSIKYEGSIDLGDKYPVRYTFIINDKRPVHVEIECDDKNVLGKNFTFYWDEKALKDGDKLSKSVFDKIFKTSTSGR